MACGPALLCKDPGYCPLCAQALPRIISFNLQYEYPDLYNAEDSAPVGDDANILAQRDPEPPAAQEGPQPSFEAGRDFASP